MIGTEIIKKNVIEDPVWTKSIKQVGYDPTKGFTNTYTVAQRPDFTNEPTFTPVGISNGTNSLCEPPTSTVAFSGMETKTFFLEQAQQKSPDICLDDIAFALNGKAEVEAIVDNLAVYSRFVKTRYVQRNYTKLAGNKVVAMLPTGPGTNSNATRTDDTFSTYPGVAATAKLTQGVLDVEVDRLNFNGGASGAYKIEGGSPIYTTLLGREASDYLILGNAAIRQDVRWDADRVSDLTGPLGLTKVLRSNAHAIIQFPRRFTFTAGAYVEVFPYATAPVVSGTRNRVEVNPNYLNVATAPYEEAVIWNDSGYQLAVPDKVAVPRGTTYQPQDYTGEFMFRNIPGYVCIIGGVPIPTNLKGNTGVFLATWRFGSRAPRPELMTSIIFQRCGYGNDAVACTYQAGGAT